MFINNSKCDNLLDAIGNTPLVKMNHIGNGLKASIWAKLEFANPGGSVKDRIARYMIEKAEKEGRLKPGETIIENSSGNTAMGLAIVAIQKGYKCKIVIRDTTTPEKIRMLQHLGVETILVDTDLPPEDECSYNNYAKNLARRDHTLYYIDQHNNLENNEAHYYTTGPEIWQQMNGKIDYLIGGIGTGGTIMGAGKYLKEMDPKIKVIGIDAKGSVFYDYFKHGKLVKAHRYLLEGVGDEFIIKTFQKEYLDDMIRIDDDTAFKWTRRMAAKEGIIAGGSSGGNIYGAVKLAREIDREANIVTIFPDSGYKYMSTLYA